MDGSYGGVTINYRTPARWSAAASPTSPPAMPLLSTLELYVPMHTSEDTKTRVSLFTCIARYLVHFTPALRYLRPPPRE